MEIRDCHDTINTWLEELNRYSFAQLVAKPTLKNWSMGQLYMHLIDATGYFIRQAEICLSSTEHAAEEASAAARKMFAEDAFPDKLIEGPPSNKHTPQPESRELIIGQLDQLKKQLANIAPRFQADAGTGKTKHPGLHYFTAGEWLQFANMHMQHHFRQKKRIDAFLAGIPKELQPHSGN